MKKKIMGELIDKEIENIFLQKKVDTLWDIVFFLIGAVAILSALIFLR